MAVQSRRDRRRAPTGPGGATESTESGDCVWYNDPRFVHEMHLVPPPDAGGDEEKHNKKLTKQNLRWRRKGGGNTLLST